MRLSYVFATLATLMWAGNFIVGRAVNESMSAIELNFWRWSIAALILLPFTYGKWRENSAVIRQSFRSLLALACTGIALYHCLVYIALQSTGSINATLVNSAVPVFVPILAYFILAKQLTVQGLIGTGLSILGVTIVICKGSPLQIFDLAFVPGDIIMLLAALIWSLYTVLLSKAPKLPATLFLFLISGLGVCLLSPFMFYQVMYVGVFELSVNNVLATAYIAVFAAVLAFLCWNKAVQIMGPVKTGLFANLIPVFSAFLAVLFLQEALRLYHFIALALIVLGIYLNSGNLPTLSTKLFKSKESHYVSRKDRV